VEPGGGSLRFPASTQFERGIIMKRYLLAGIIAGSWSSCVLAADLGPYRPAPYERDYEPVRTAVWDWTGPYIGANLGYAWGESNPATLSGPGFRGPVGTLEPEGWLGGGQIGANAQYDWFVVGLEADIQATSIEDSTAALVGPGYTGRASYDIDWLSTLRGRVGVASGPALLYVTGGWAFADVEYNVTATGPMNVSMSESGIRTGYALGGGLEWALDDHWSVKSEYLYVDLGNAAVSAPGFAATTDTELHNARVGLNYRF
jgi:outer membrane immunogenic protein